VRPTVYALQLHSSGRRRPHLHHLLGKDGTKDDEPSGNPTLLLSLAVHKSKLPPRRKNRMVKLQKRGSCTAATKSAPRLFPVPVQSAGSSASVGLSAALDRPKSDRPERADKPLAMAACRAQSFQPRSTAAAPGKIPLLARVLQQSSHESEVGSGAAATHAAGDSATCSGLELRPASDSRAARSVKERSMSRGDGLCDSSNVSAQL